MDSALLLALAVSAVGFFVGFFAGHVTGTRTARAAPVWVLAYGVVAFFFAVAIGLSNYSDDAADAGGRAFALPLWTALGLVFGIGFAAGTRSGARR
jgi:hypothetical protein